MEITGDRVCRLNIMCSNTHFLITVTSKPGVICILLPVLRAASQLSLVTPCFSASALYFTFASPPFHSLSSVYLWLLAAANLCSDFQRNDSILNTIFFCTSSFNLLSFNSTEERTKKKNPVCVGGEREAEMVSVSERGLGPCKTRHSQELLEGGGGSGPNGTHPCVIPHCLCVFILPDS